MPLAIALAIGAAALIDGDGSDGGPRTGATSRAPVTTSTSKEHSMQQHPYLGVWVTADGRIRQELRPDGRYDEARSNVKSAYQGRYEVRGTHIDYRDDTGFTADGTFVSADELHHGGMVFHRQRER